VHHRRPVIEKAVVVFYIWPVAWYKEAQSTGLRASLPTPAAVKFASPAAGKSKSKEHEREREQEREQEQERDAPSGLTPLF
jgi:ribosomal protein L12E/L44/L45/RPP1/RPP2